jgi:osmotically-inducible protein OsmY
MPDKRFMLIVSLNQEIKQRRNDALVKQKAMKQDEEIEREIQQNLQSESRLNAENIKIEVHNGEVTLFGTTESYPRLSYAQKAAKKVEGVKSIRNIIKVIIPSPDKKSDDEIRKTVLNLIVWNSAIDANKVRITVKNGWVTLEGTVDLEYKLTKAELLTKDVTGVTGVTNRLIVVSPECFYNSKMTINIELPRGIWIRLR